MNVIRVAAVLLCGLFTAAFAQDALVGKYTGHRTGERGGPRATELEIVSAEGSKVKATLTRYGGRSYSCGGATPMEGTYTGNTLELSTVKTPDLIAGCETNLTVTLTGNKLTGTIGPNKRNLELSK